MKQVLVLGAGASFPYGFSVGADLRKKILNQYFPNLFVFARNRAHYEPHDEIAFFENFRDSNLSIDKFTDYFQKRTDTALPIASRAICQIIGTEESTSTFREDRERNSEFVRGGSKDWYSLFWNLLNQGISNKEAFLERCKDLNVITFNYDRSLEVFLLSSMYATFGGADLRDLRESNLPFKIVHVYGSLGSFEEKKYSAEVAIGSDYRGKIQLIGDARATARTSELRKILQEANKIFFVGFSYAPENLEVLGLPVGDTVIESGGNSAKEINGTVLGLKQGQIRRFIPKISSSSTRTLHPDTDTKGRDFFDEDSYDMLQDRLYFE